MTQQPPGWDPYRQSQGGQQPYGQQPYGADPYGQPSHGQQPPYGQSSPHGEMVPYQQPPQPVPVYQAQPFVVTPAGPKTAGLAVAALVCSLVGLVLCYFAFILELLALIFGIIAKRQIKDRGLSGNGMATAGIVISSIVLGLEVIVVIGYFILFGSLVGLGTLTNP